jgi:hypothetical protein
MRRALFFSTVMASSTWIAAISATDQFEFVPGISSWFVFGETSCGGRSSASPKSRASAVAYSMKKGLRRFDTMDVRFFEAESAAIRRLNLAALSAITIAEGSLAEAPGPGPGRGILNWK